MRHESGARHPGTGRVSVESDSKSARGKPGDRVQLTFTIKDPKSGAAVTKFETVHEKLFHMFIVSQDLDILCARPSDNVGTTARFVLEASFLRQVCIAFSRTIIRLMERRNSPPKRFSFLAGSLGVSQPEPDLAAKRTGNMDVELTTDPTRPIAGF